MIPDNYANWRHCIEVHCGLSLTPEFLAARLGELSDPTHERTQQFARLYGADHLRQVIGWFQRAAAEA